MSLLTLFIFVLLQATTMSAPREDFDKLWDYTDPAATEAKFRAILPPAEASGDRAYYAQLLTQVARAQGLQSKFGEANATLDAVERILNEDGADQPTLTRVRYLLERGRVLNSSERPAEARPLFEQAFELAERAELDPFTIDAAHMIAIVEPSPKLQINWNERALALAERSTDERARRWRASLCNNIGWSYFDHEQYGPAMIAFEMALAFRTEAGKPRDIRIARYAIAKTLRMQKKIDEAIAIDREIVEQAAEAKEPDGFFLEELAECLLALGKNDDAKPYFRRAYEQLSKDAWLSEHEPERLQRLNDLAK